MQESATRKNFERWAKLGYGARGVVYLVLGALALLSTMHASEITAESLSSKGAISSLRQLPLGDVILLVLAAGLLGYALWRFLQGFGDADGHGRSFKALAVRASLVISGVTHALLAAWVLSRLTATSAPGSGGGNWTFTDLDLWLLGIAGVAVIGAGLAHIYKGATAGFERYMALPPSNRQWLRPLCQFGLIARGLVWCVLGWILLQWTWVLRQRETPNISDALEWLSQMPYGEVLLKIAAIGLMAFGIYGLLEARYRRISTTS